MVTVYIISIVVALALLLYDSDFLRNSEGRYRALMHIAVGVATVSALYKLSVICAYDIFQTVFYNERVLETNRDVQILMLALVFLIVATVILGVRHIKRVNELLCSEDRKEIFIYIAEMFIRIFFTYRTILSVIAHFDVSSIKVYSFSGLMVLFVFKWIIIVPVIVKVMKYAFDNISARIRGRFC